MSDPNQPSVPAGWYPDGQGSDRWWDGSQWTDHTRPMTPEPEQQPEPVREQPAPTAAEPPQPTEPEQPEEPAFEFDSPTVVAPPRSAGGAATPGAPAAPAEPEPADEPGFDFDAQTSVTPPTSPAPQSPYSTPSYGEPPAQPSYGEPPAQTPYGAPEQPSYGGAPAQPPYGAPPSQPPFGAPPAAPPFGAPPPPPAAPAFGQPFGSPPGQPPFGAPPFGATPFGAAARPGGGGSKKNLIIVLAIVGVLVIAGAVTAIVLLAGGGSSKHDPESVAKEYTQAFADGDFEAACKLMTPDYQKSALDSEDASDCADLEEKTIDRQNSYYQSAYDASYEEIHGDMKYSFDVTSTETDGDKSTVKMDAKSEYTGDNQEYIDQVLDGEKEKTDSFTIELEKQDNGDWLVAHDE